MAKSNNLLGCFYVNSKKIQKHIPRIIYLD
jgi:hypothetical protein